MRDFKVLQAVRTSTHRMMFAFALISSVCLFQDLKAQGCPKGNEQKVCQGSSTIINLSTLLSTTGVDGTWYYQNGDKLSGLDERRGTLDIEDLSVGTYPIVYHYYADESNDCSADGEAIVTIEVVAAPQAGQATHIKACSDDASTIILSQLLDGEISSGTWSESGSNPSGGVFSQSPGTFLPTGAQGVYYFTYTLSSEICGEQTATVSITVDDEELNDGSSAQMAICSSTQSVLDLYSLISGEERGGVWTAAGNPSGGTFSSASGTFDPSGVTIGVPYHFVYKFLSNCNNNDPETVLTITFTEPKNAGEDISMTVCATSQTLDLGLILQGEDPNGSWIADSNNPGGGLSGSLFEVDATTFHGIYQFHYTFLASAGCPETSSTVTIHVEDQPSVGVSSSLYICEGTNTSINLFNAIENEEHGGEWTAQSNPALVNINNPAQVDFSNAPAGTYEFHYTTNNITGCTDASFSVGTVIVGSEPEAGTGGTLNTCNGILDLTKGGEYIDTDGGTWVDVDNTGVDLADPTQVDFANLPVGSYTYLYVFDESTGCWPDQAEITVVIPDTPTTGTGSIVDYCENNDNVISLSELLVGETMGGTWTVSGTLDPGAAFDSQAGTLDLGELGAIGSFDFIYDLDISCNVPSSNVSVTIAENNSAGNNNSIRVCNDNIAATPLDLNQYLEGQDPGGTWTESSHPTATLNFDSSTGIFTVESALPAGTYYFNYNIDNTSPCNDDVSEIAVIIETSPSYPPVDQDITICVGDTNPINLYDHITSLGGDDGGVFTLTPTPADTVFNPFTGIFDPVDITSATSFAVEYEFLIDCNPASYTFDIHFQDTRTTGIAENYVICDGNDTNIDLFAQLDGADQGGMWTDLNNQNFDLSDPSNVDFSTVPVGKYDFSYSFARSGSCEPMSTTLSIVKSETELITGYGSSESICEGDETIINLFDLLNGEQDGGVWTDSNGDVVPNPSSLETETLAPDTYIFTYGFVGDANCPIGTNTTDVSIVISSQAEAGDNGSFHVCVPNTTPIDITPANSDANGRWTENGTNPSFNVLDPLLNEFDPSTALAGEYHFSYIQLSSASCPADTAMITVFVSDQSPNSGSDVDTMVCITTESPIDLNQYLSDDADLGGEWALSAPVSDATLDPSGLFSFDEGFNSQTVSLTYEFASGNGCTQSRIAEILLRFIDDPTGENGIVTICDHEQNLIDLYTITGADASNTDVTVTDLDNSGADISDATSVDFTQVPHGTYRFEFRVDGSDAVCSPASSVATVIVTSQPEAGTGGTYELCNFNSTTPDMVTVNLNNLIVGADPGGVWSGPQPQAGSFDEATGLLTITTATTSRSYYYTYGFNFDGNSPCDDDEAVIHIKVIENCSEVTPCLGTQRYNVGSSWNDDGTVDDESVTGGIVKCGEEETVFPVGAATETYNSDVFKIDLEGRSFYDPNLGYFMTPNEPQETEQIIWINFDVRAYVKSFEMLLDDNEDIAWALYRSNTSTQGTSIFTPNSGDERMELSGDCANLTLVRTGLASEVYNTIVVDDKHRTQASNYYLAIWDQSSNTLIGDIAGSGDSGSIISKFATRMGCEEENTCSPPVVNGVPRFVDNKDGTYTITIRVQGVNGEYEAVDVDDNALEISRNICLSNSNEESPITSGSFSLTYANDVSYKIQVRAVDPTKAPTCNASDNYEMCVSDFITPPSDKLQIACNGGLDASIEYHSFDMVPSDTYDDVKITQSCGLLPVDVVYGDVITQTGPFQYDVVRHYTAFGGCQIPGEADDQQAFCTVTYKVNYEYYRPDNDCDLACNLEGINIGINDQCEVLITPEMILTEVTDECLDDYYVVLTDPEYGDAVVANPVNKNYIGKTLQARVSFIGGGQVDNSCWGYVTIEDKLPPFVYCPQPDTISCNAEIPKLNFAAWVEDACANFQVEIIEEVTEEYECNVYTDIIAKKTISYIAVDDSGNESETCDYTVYFEKETITLEHFPDDVVLSCEKIAEYDEDNDGQPDPKYTGGPMLGGRSLVPNLGHCKIEATFEDQIIPICGTSYKILRKWTVYDWCLPTNGTTNPISDYQIIKVVDQDGPNLVCAEKDTTVNADAFSCGLKDYKVSLPEVAQSCGTSNFHYTIGWLPKTNNWNHLNADTTGVYTEDGQYFIKEIPYGTHIIVITVTDECGNSSWCSYEIEVVDNVPPIPVCDEETVVTLSNDNRARVYAESFDDGSFDFCTDVTLKVARLEGPECDGQENPIFRPYVDFCCSDLGAVTMVVLEATDEQGNRNTCTVRAIVEDKLPPEFKYYPNDTTIYCGTDIDSLDLGMPTVDDECSSYTITYEDNGLNQCGIGQNIRTWYLLDANDNVIDSYDQSIIVVNKNPFVALNEYFPDDYIATDGCKSAGISPDVTGDVNVPDTVSCALIASSYEDQNFEIADSVCFRVLRNWTIIDWCQYDEDKPSANNPGLWRHTQTIEVKNSDAPVFADECTTVNVQSNSAESCSGAVTLQVNVSDDCTPVSQITVNYSIYLADGQTLTGTGHEFQSASLPVGNHSITWDARDQCGNRSSCTSEFSVRDQKAPTPYCVGGVTTVIMETGNYVDIWPSDFDLGSSDNCDSDLYFQIKLAGTDDDLAESLRFTCGEGGRHDIEVWVTDDSGNSDYCRTSLSVQENTSCNNANGPDGSQAMVSGYINTSKEDAIENVEVTMQQSADDKIHQTMTDARGEYRFENMTTDNSYIISAQKSDEPTLGVSTRDILLIQRYIIGLSDFENAYQTIAADANFTESVTTADIAEIRKVLLGINDNFKNDKAWTFVPKDEVFYDIEQPWPYSEDISIINLQKDTEKDFMAIKIGDIDGALNNVTTRSHEPFVLAAVDKKSQAGELIAIDLKVSQTELITGLQLGVNVDGHNFEIVEITSDNINIDKAHYRLDGNALKLTWSEGEGVNILDNENLLTMTLRAKKSGVSIANSLTLDDGILKNEMYDSELNIAPVQMNFEKDVDATASATLSQNSPNPFLNYTKIGYELSHSTEVRFRVFDVNGKTLYEINEFKNAGKYEVTLNGSDIKQSGILYYELQTADERLTRKMIKIE